MLMDNLVDKDTVRERAGFTGNSNITDDEIDAYIVQARGVMLSYLSGRYNITDFTDAKFGDGTTNSQAYDMLEKIQSDLAVSYLLKQEYGIQQFNEDNGAIEKEENAMKLLIDINEGNLRMIDLEGAEFSLLPRTSNRTSKTTVVSNTSNPADFKKEDRR